MWTLAIDAMGGDNAPKEIIDGTVNALEKNKDIKVLLYGIEEEIKKYLPIVPERMTIINCSEVIETCEPPLIAIRKKVDSSLIKGLLAVKSGEADAFISAGSTGAVMAGALFKVGRIKGIDRPALAPVLPTKQGKALLIDCGANADCDVKFLEQFALMGSAYMELVEDVKNPRVGLINIGVEEEKGNKLYKETFKALGVLNGINFVGNIEARDTTDGEADVLVCDGFTGNIVLKTLEGMATYLFSLIKEQIMQNGIRKLGYLLMKSGFRKVRDKLDHKAYGGAPLLGIQGCVIKAHGSSDAFAFNGAITQALKYLEGDVTNVIRQKIEAVSEAAG
ncbi:MAG: phosphate acyltransferase PlsX [Clostridia bacterium]|nr:phosphate acyltransferase PlsX [Clostridia bacterium]